MTAFKVSILALSSTYCLVPSTFIQAHKILPPTYQATSSWMAHLLSTILTSSTVYIRSQHRNTLPDTHTNVGNDICERRTIGYSNHHYVWVHFHAQNTRKTTTSYMRLHQMYWWQEVPDNRCWLNEEEYDNPPIGIRTLIWIRAISIHNNSGMIWTGIIKHWRDNQPEYSIYGWCSEGDRRTKP